MASANYGTDAPYVPIGFGVAAGAGAAFFLVGMIWDVRGLEWFGAFNAAVFTASAASYLLTTWWGKIAVWAELLDAQRLQGHESALDVGCGRGLVLIPLARRLPNGRAIGLDLWSHSDQSGNSAESTLGNARDEGVADRIEVVTGDMRQLPFADGTFDLVTSALAIHNVPDAAGRATALDEIVRVLRPGGVALLADFQHTADYQRHLEARGVSVERRNLGWRYWYGGPQAATRLVTFRKPG